MNDPVNDDFLQLRAVMEAAVDGVITISERGLIEGVNPAAELLFGYTAEEMVGRNVNMLMPSPYQEEHDGYLQRYVQGGPPKIIGIGREVEGRRRDGSTFPLYLAVSEIRLQDRRIFTGFVHDLTDVKQAQQRATQLGQILEDSLNEIFVFDVETLQFVFANHGALENLGYAADEITRFTPVDIKPRFTREQFDSTVDPLRHAETSVQEFETVHQRKDGSEYDVLVRLQMAEWNGRSVFVAIVLDISERRRAEQRLAELNARLEQRVEQRTRELRDAQEQLVRREKLAALGQLSGGVAHEIRNPLGVIRNSVYFMRMNVDQLDEDMAECVTDIEREVETANRIVSELLDFTRDPPAQKERFAVGKAIDTALRSARVPPQVAVERMGATESLYVQADQGQIERVLTNLIRNAWQAMDGAGQLTIVCRLHEGGGGDGADNVQIDIQDTGPGIPSEQLSRIFEPLYTTRAKGIGLGLAVSRRYAERNGGELIVDSRVGSGTTFTLTLPGAEVSDG